MSTVNDRNKNQNNKHRFVQNYALSYQYECEK